MVTDSRQAFEAWYACNAFNYERDPIGSRECGLQWAAWQASRAQALTEVLAIIEDTQENTRYDAIQTIKGRLK